MAQRRSKKKRSSREDYPIREQLKIEEGVFDMRTMLRLKNLFTHDIISSLRFLIARGKEADIYLADAGEKVNAEFVAVKIFRIETSSYYRRLPYMLGDPRFSKIKKDKYNLVNEWCKKEFGNLKIAERAKVAAPKPYLFDGNVLAMEFLGSDGTPSPRLRDIKIENPKATFDKIVKDLHKLYSNQLVHADISEYNILMKNGKPYLIDFGQAVVLKHLNATNFLKRDVEILAKYFERAYSIKIDLGETFEKIISEK